MRKPFALALATLSLGIAFPASAATPEEDLDCAIWTTVMMEQLGSDPKAKQGLGFVANWFIGLYEGATGALIDEPIKRRSIELEGQSLDEIQATCLARMTEYGARLSRLGAEMKGEGAAPGAEQDEEDASPDAE